ncbi:MAG: complex I subunit 1 family protein [Thermofilaceae archaeon]
MLVLELLAAAPLVVAVSLLYDGIDRKVRARMHGRVGPPFVQPFYDLVKLFSKDRVVPRASARLIYVASPLLSVALAVTGGSLLLAGLVGSLQVPGDVILIFALLTASSLLLMVGGASSGNPYAAVSLTRGISVLFSYKMPMMISAITASASGVPLLSIAGTVELQRKTGSLAFSSISGALAFTSFFLCMPSEGEVTPFDVTTAETEVVYGFMIEYGGPYLALVKLAKSVSRFTAALLASSLFLYTSLGSRPIELATCILEAVMLALVSVTALGTFMARVKVRQVIGFYWRLPVVLAFGAFAMFLLGRFW